MALFESYERRIDKINSVLNSYGIASIDAHSCQTLCNLMDCSTPGFPVPHHLQEFVFPVSCIASRFFTL